MSDKLINIFYQSHAGSWAFLVILFVIAFVLFKIGIAKGGKIVHMILRLFYIIMLVSGVGTLIGYGFPLMYIIKGILAFFMIGLMEMVLGRTQRKEPAGMFLILLIFFVAIVVLMGYGVISF
ncbi:DUF1516 family protein [Paenibacillaceae bacterium]|nr:DUF1516 family protein [Paenibacillaceae bacterium]